MFVGVHERQLDPKGRVALPAAFRPRLEPRCYLALGADKCVDILTAEAFEQVASDMMEKVRRGEVDRTQQRAKAASIIVKTFARDSSLPAVARLVNPTNFESTLGAGQKIDLETVPTFFTSAHHAA